MKQSIFFLSLLSLTILISYSCSTIKENPDIPIETLEQEPDYTIYPGPDEASRLLHLWEKAVRTKDIELLLEIMPYPNLRYTPELAETIHFQGINSFKAFRFDFFDRLGPAEEYSLPPLDDYFHYGDIDVYDFWHKTVGTERNLKEMINIEKDNGKWIIGSSAIVIFMDGPVVHNHLQAQSDIDKDGFLTDMEAKLWSGMMYNLVEGPHTSVNYLDDFFDTNKDNFINTEEINSAAKIIIGKGYRFARGAFGAFVPEYDNNNNEWLDDEEIEEMIAVISDASQPQSKRAPITQTMHWYPMADYIFATTPRKAIYSLDILADANEDGWIDNKEQQILESTFTAHRDGIIDEHKQVKNYLDRLIDRNKDGGIGWSERRMALQISAMDWSNQSLLPPPYPAHTPTDKLLDKSKNGLIEEEEIKAAVILFSGETNGSNLISDSLFKQVDINNNGKITTQEIQKAKSLLFYPRKVKSENLINTISDIDKDGFIDVIEIGLFAGRANGTPVPSFDDLIDIYRRRGTTEQIEAEKLETNIPRNTAPETKNYRQNIEEMEGKHIAVLEIELGLSSLDEQFTNLLTIFVENAFVNIGSLNLVDRRNFDKLYKEMTFQLSGMVDEETAVELGHMTGADIIALGEINQMGKLYYLNVKLITVETAEIISSSISQTGDLSGFLEMANQVVNKLF